MNTASSPARIQIVKVDAGQWSQASDVIIEEEVLKILINDVPGYDLVYSTGNPMELVTGLLFSQGIINTCADILACELDHAARVCRVRVKNPGRPNPEKSVARGSSGGYLVPGALWPSPGRSGLHLQPPC